MSPTGQSVLSSLLDIRQVGLNQNVFSLKYFDLFLVLSLHLHSFILQFTFFILQKTFLLFLFFLQNSVFHQI